MYHSVPHEKKRVLKVSCVDKEGSDRTSLQTWWGLGDWRRGGWKCQIGPD